MNSLFTSIVANDCSLPGFELSGSVIENNSSSLHSSYRSDDGISTTSHTENCDFTPRVRERVISLLPDETDLSHIRQLQPVVILSPLKLPRIMKPSPPSLSGHSETSGAGTDNLPSASPQKSTPACVSVTRTTCSPVTAAALDSEQEIGQLPLKSHSSDLVLSNHTAALPQLPAPANVPVIDNLHSPVTAAAPGCAQDVDDEVKNFLASDCFLQGKVLNIVYPRPNQAVCPITDCSFVAHSDSWRNTLFSLINHIVLIHNVETDDYNNWCSVCHCTFKERATKHSCFSADCPPIRHSSVKIFNCHLCKFTAASKAQLKSHRRSSHSNYDPYNMVEPANSPSTLADSPAVAAPPASNSACNSSIGHQLSDASPILRAKSYDASLRSSNGSTPTPSHPLIPTGVCKTSTPVNKGDSDRPSDEPGGSHPSRSSTKLPSVMQHLAEGSQLRRNLNPLVTRNGECAESSSSPGANRHETTHDPHRIPGTQEMLDTLLEMVATNNDVSRGPNDFSTQGSEAEPRYAACWSPANQVGNIPPSPSLKGSPPPFPSPSAGMNNSSEYLEVLDITLTQEELADAAISQPSDVVDSPSLAAKACTANGKSNSGSTIATCRNAPKKFRTHRDGNKHHVMVPTANNQRCTTQQTSAKLPKHPTGKPTAPTQSWNSLRAEKTHREGTSLHIMFPTTSSQRCTEEECSYAAKASTWYTTVASLSRHLFAVHNVKIWKSVKWCLHCKQRTGPCPSKHPCLKDGMYRDEVTAEGNFRCSKCNFRTTTKLGLNNHVKKHKKDALASKKKNLQPDPRIKTSRVTSGPQVLSSPNNIGVKPNSYCEALKKGPPSMNPEPPRSDHLPRRTLAQIVQDQGRGPIKTWIAPPTVDDPIPTQTSGPTGEAPPEEEAPPEGELPRGSRDWLPSPDSPLDKLPPLEAAFHQRLKDTLKKSRNHQTWDEFTVLDQEITAEIHKICRIKPFISKNNQTPAPIDPTNCRQIQRLYRRNPKRAIRCINGDESGRCTRSKDDIFSYFRDAWPTRECDPSLYVADDTGRDPVSMEAFSPAEVQDKLAQAGNSAAGPDRITYQNLRTTDPECTVLANMFNICLKHQKVPPSWKASNTILIPKAGDPEDISNWRPIALSGAIYKLFTKCLTGRLSAWMSENHVLSPCQKGFLPYDGVFEHNFALQERVRKAKTEKSELALAFLDIANAFGAVPHEAILTALRSAGAGTAFTALIQDIYQDSSTSIITNDGLTEGIQVCSGVKQGCPLSGVLFNLAINPILEQIQGSHDYHKILGYADDLVLIATSQDELQNSLDIVHTLTQKICLKLKPSKCKSFHFVPKPTFHVAETTFNIGTNRIPPMAEGDIHPFLGKPFGLNFDKRNETISGYVNSALNILTSMLAPWQKLDAMRTFFFPALQFAMRTGQLSKTDWVKLDKKLKPEFKKVLYLPPHASNEYIYGARRSGCCGVSETATESDIHLIDNAFKLLTSKDPVIIRMAEDSLLKVVSDRLQIQPSAQEIARYLSGITNEEFTGTTASYQSVWSRARGASRRLGITWIFEDDLSPTIRNGDQHLYPDHRLKVVRKMKENIRFDLADNLFLKPTQGKSIVCAAWDAASTHFLYTGEYTEFCDWRFIHRARLNLLPLYGAKHWAVGHSKRCRKCNYVVESAAHVLEHCGTYSTSWKNRHNAIATRLARLARSKGYEVSEDKKLDHLPGRPDLVLTKGDTALLIDVTIPYENRRSSFKEARQRKVETYSQHATHLKRKFSTVINDAFIVGALGSWDPANDHLLQFFCSKTQARKIKRICCSEVIKYSRDLYIEFVTGRKQVRDRRPDRFEKKNQARNVPDPQPADSQHEVTPAINHEVQTFIAEVRQENDHLRRKSTTPDKSTKTKGDPPPSAVHPKKPNEHQATSSTMSHQIISTTAEVHLPPTGKPTMKPKTRRRPTIFRAKRQGPSQDDISPDPPSGTGPKELYFDPVSHPEDWAQKQHANSPGTHTGEDTHAGEDTKDKSSVNQRPKDSS